MEYIRPKPERDYTRKLPACTWDGVKAASFSLPGFTPNQLVYSQLQCALGIPPVSCSCWTKVRYLQHCVKLKWPIACLWHAHYLCHYVRNADLINKY